MAATLMFLCGKMAAGQTTLSRQLAERADAVVLEQEFEAITALFQEPADDEGFTVIRYARG